MTTLGKKKIRRRLDPDPVAIFLTALSALGSLAGIYSVLEHRKERRELNLREERSNVARRKIFRSVNRMREYLADLKDNLFILTEMLRTQKGFLNGDIEPNVQSMKPEPSFRFGEMKLLLNRYELRIYGDLYNSILVDVRNINNTTMALIKEIYKSTDSWVDSPIWELRDLIDLINDFLFTKSNKNKNIKTFKESIHETFRIMEQAIRIIENLHEWLTGINGRI